MSKKGAIVYLVLTFLLGYTVQFLGFRFGILRIDNTAGLFGYLALAAALFIPALSAWLASLIEKSGRVTGSAYWPVPVGKALFWVVAMPVIFLVVHGLTALVGASTLNPGMGGLVVQVKDLLVAMRLPAMTESTEKVVLPAAAIVAGIPLSALLGATLFMALALGGEIGWRGFLLPRLLPLGRVPAHALGGLFWGMWFLPTLLAWLDINPHLKADTWVFVLRLLGMSVFLSVVLGEVWLRSRNMLLTALVLGSFAAQQFGVWSYLFENPSRPWAGGTGVIAIAVWFVIALITRFAPRHSEESPGPEPVQAEANG